MILLLSTNMKNKYMYIYSVTWKLTISTETDHGVLKNVPLQLLKKLQNQLST